MRIEFHHWPWQCVAEIGVPYDPKTQPKYGWIYRGIEGRFGDRWNWALGIYASRDAIHLNLIFGIIRIFRGPSVRWEKKHWGVVPMCDWPKGWFW